MHCSRKSFITFTEENIKECVIAFCRFNPPTTGHAKLIEFTAKKGKGKSFRIYVSQSQDPKKNPLSYDSKIKFMRKMFPAYARQIILDTKIKNIFTIANAVYEDKFTKLTVVVGSDRVQEFKKLLDKYHGVDGAYGYYKFRDGIDVVSAGERDPDSDDVSGMSASKMIAAAAENNLAKFTSGLPATFKEVKQLFNAVRVGMGLNESYIFRPDIKINYSANRTKYIGGETFNIGESVYTHSDLQKAKPYIIKERYSNYVVVHEKNNLDLVKRLFISDIRSYDTTPTLV